jgi:hypothetical protein
MSIYHLKKTFNTPEVKLNPSEGYLIIEGRSIPEDPNDFYEDIISHLEEYYQNPQVLTKIDLKLENVNSGSSKVLLEILRMIESQYDNDNDCIINWYYEEDDESIQELGQHYKNTVKVPFNLVEYY